MNAKKINSISDFNSFLDEDYKSLNQSSESWYPIMYYNEDINLKDKNYMTIGINPSLTKNAKKYINEILEINQSNNNKGIDRFNSFRNDKARKIKELINYQHELKYNKQITYFKTIDQFFESVGKDFKRDVFHYDFCQLRNTDSCTVREWIFQNNHLNKLVEHLDKILNLVKPKYVFIFNATLVKILMEKKESFFERKNHGLKKLGKDFYFYNEYINDDCVCTRNDIKFIIGNQLSGGATSRVYRANLIANVNRLLKKTDKENLKS